MRVMTLLAACASIWAAMGAAAAQPADQEAIQALLRRIEQQDLRIQALEAKLGSAGPSHTPAAPAATPVSSEAAAVPVPKADTSHAEEAAASAMAAQMAAAASAAEMQGHNMAIPGGGPTLNVRGFFDFNFGTGSIANPLMFPIADNGCGTCGNPVTPPHSTFQAGEFDLYLTSRLSDHLRFVAEIVLGPDTTNAFVPDIERYQLTYTANRYFSVAAGRFHTSIGYYNTAYHHGNWFSTAEGRPIMYLFEDSGGILPVHMVGLNFAGAVPHTEALGLHWVAEMGNGLSSNPYATNSVQNFNADRNYKATNLAAYIKPESLPGLQIGASWYHDGLNPSQAQNPLPLPEIRQNIYSAHIVYFSPNWEFMNEGVLLSNHPLGAREPYRSPMAYTQLARKFGMYKPYFRYQYVHDNAGDPVNLLKGLYYGPSVGVRVDFSEYAAFKLQYNRLTGGGLLAANGLNAQVAFTF
jgi:hypothetical protein